MIASIVDPGLWVNLFFVTLIQIALGADNLIIITIIANKLPLSERKKAIRFGLVIAMAFRIVLLALVSVILRMATTEFYNFDARILPGVNLQGALSGKALLLAVGGLFLIWKGVKELRIKLKGVEENVQQAKRFTEVVAVIVGMNLLFSVDSILTVVGMTDVFLVMLGSVVISVGFMLYFAGRIADFLHKNPEFEILGLFVLLLIGFVLILEGGHVGHFKLNGDALPYIPQWTVIFILLLMFSVDLYQNWWERKQQQAPIELRHRKK